MIMVKDIISENTSMLSTVDRVSAIFVVMYRVIIQYRVTNTG